MTVQRQIILDVVREYPHTTAEQIYAKAIEKIPRMAVAPVYNNLDYLSDNGYIRRIKIAGEPDHFDKTVEPHYHIICDVCKVVEDIELDNIMEQIQKKHRLELTYCEVNLHHICPRCKENEANNC